MSETKMCPFCAEEIMVNAIKCKHCGEFFDQDQKRATEINSTNKSNKDIAGNFLKIVIGGFIILFILYFFGMMIFYGGK